MNRIFSLSAIFLAGLCLWCMRVHGTEGIAEPTHRQALEAARDQAKKLEEKNLNRFALEALYRYNTLYDSLYQAEKKDTLGRIAAELETESAARRHLADSLATQVDKASRHKEDLRMKYMRLLRKAVIALVLWLGIVAVVLVLRTRAMRRNRVLLAASEES